MLTLGSCFAGIGGFELAAIQTQHIQPIWSSEIQPFPQTVTQHHFPTMLHMGDIHHITASNVITPDILTGGTPCQDFSLARRTVKREHAGLSGPKSSLIIEFLRLINQLNPPYTIWENVPGALTSNNGEDFEYILAAFVGEHDPTKINIPKRSKDRQSGYLASENASVAWRTMDAQYFGVPQQRRRVFLVRYHRGYSERPARILFEPRRRTYRFRTREEANLTAHQRRYPRKVGAFNQANGIMHTVTTKFNTRVAGEFGRKMDNIYVDHNTPLRRYMPIELERAFGFPDNWTNIGNPSDYARVTALGNSLAVPCVKFIFDRLLQEKQAFPTD